jgi:hypothetical protein
LGMSEIPNSQVCSLLRCFTVDLRAISRTHGHFRGLFRI